jgi:hypothetical protein
MPAFARERARYNDLMADKAQLETILRRGAEKARAAATQTIELVRARVGTGPVRQPIAPHPTAE